MISNYNVINHIRRLHWVYGIDGNDVYAEYDTALMSWHHSEGVKWLTVAVDAKTWQKIININLDIQTVKHPVLRTECLLVLGNIYVRKLSPAVKSEWNIWSFHIGCWIPNAKYLRQQCNEIINHPKSTKTLIKYATDILTDIRKEYYLREKHVEVDRDRA